MANILLVNFQIGEVIKTHKYSYCSLDDKVEGIVCIRSFGGTFSELLSMTVKIDDGINER